MGQFGLLIMLSEVNDKNEQTSAQSEVSRQILQEEAQRTLSGTPSVPLRLSSKPDGFGPVYGPAKEPDGDALQKHQNYVDARGYRINEPKFNESPRTIQNFRDDIADKVFPGFGRLQSSDNQWRLDYLDPSACNTRARVGLCFKITR